jgi:5-methylcytosine-specific restriction endonuclease McrA
MSFVLLYLIRGVDIASSNLGNTDQRSNEAASMVMPFDAYPYGGKQLLGRRTGANARREYGLRLQRLTGQTTCAWCGVDLVADFYRWLLLSVDHVVPTSEARRLGIPLEFSEDYVNHVLACAGCNGFDNRYHGTHAPRDTWTLEESVALRDAIFLERKTRIAERRSRDQGFFESRPWQP